MTPAARYAALCVLSTLACARPPGPRNEPASAPQEPAEEQPPAEELEPMLPALDKQDLVEGTGAAAQQGDRVLVHYRGTLLDGTQFDSSIDRGTPFEFTIGAGMVISGWDIGVAGMKPGGKRRLRIPPHLAYGSRGSPPKIGPDETLLFEIELLDIAPK